MAEPDWILDVEVPRWQRNNWRKSHFVAECLFAVREVIITNRILFVFELIKELHHKTVLSQEIIKNNIARQ